MYLGFRGTPSREGRAEERSVPLLRAGDAYENDFGISKPLRYSRER
jgi:hypothetical protein